VLAAPVPLTQGPDYWREEILRHNHELGAARAETRRRQLQASRAEADRLPDPTVGLRYGSERDGNEKIVGLALSIPLPGSARGATAQGVTAQAEMAAHQEGGVLRKVETEAANSYAAAGAAYDTWQKSRTVADKMQANADLMAKAYALGEAGLPEVLMARRQSMEASLGATLAQVDAAESRYRLLLDAHQLWPLDVEEGPGHGHE
jgi:Outer membrane protein